MSGDNHVGRFSIPGKDGTPRFAAPRLGAMLLQDYPAARNGGSWLYAYYNEAWHEDGDVFYRATIRKWMGEAWLPTHSSSTLQWIQDGAPALDDRPPLDRIRVQNGILHLTEGGPTLEAPSVEPYTPVALPVAYEPRAVCPTFDRFIKRALPTTVARTAQEVMGYILVPDNSEQKAILAIGSGGNGKSTWLRVCRELVGPDNCAARPLQALADDRFATADLYGKLVNIYADLSSNELSSSSLFRAITGGDAISAERKMRPSFQFVPFTRLLFSANQYPSVANPLNALFDRWIILPFNRRFRGQAIEDKRLLEKMTTPGELSGILNYALAGLYRLRAQGGFTVSMASQRALDEFRLRADNVALFLTEVSREFPGVFMSRTELWERYTIWNTDTGHAKVNRNKFYERVYANYHKPVKRRGVHGWTLEGGKRGSF